MPRADFSFAADLMDGAVRFSDLFCKAFRAEVYNKIKSHRYDESSVTVGSAYVSVHQPLAIILYLAIAVLIKA